MSQKQTPVFFPNLDALRFFCFLSVFFYHSFVTDYEQITSNEAYYFIKTTLFGNGILGVNFFFVLSGFLITYLLLVEKKQHNKINIGKFYMRRILRIWPLFYFCIFFGFIVFPFFKAAFGQVPNETADPIYYIFFLANIDLVFGGLPDSSVLGILWSVAIEEQFYLFWPLIIGFIKTRFLPYTFCALLIASFIFRLVYAHNDIVVEYHTFSCISDLTVGGLGAYFSFFSSRFLNFIKGLPKTVTAFIYVGTFLLYFLRQNFFHYSPILVSFDRLIISLFFLFIILEQNFNERSFFKLQSLRNISRLGQYTYGLYCLHMIGILIVGTILSKLNFNTKLWQVLFVESLLALALTIILAYLSYHYFEKRFLLLKNKFSILPTQSENLKPVSGWGTGWNFKKFRGSKAEKV